MREKSSSAIYNWLTKVLGYLAHKSCFIRGGPRASEFQKCVNSTVTILRVGPRPFSFHCALSRLNRFCGPLMSLYNLVRVPTRHLKRLWGDKSRRFALAGFCAMCFDDFFRFFSMTSWKNLQEFTSDKAHWTNEAIQKFWDEQNSIISFRLSYFGIVLIQVYLPPILSHRKISSSCGMIAFQYTLMCHNLALIVKLERQPTKRARNWGGNRERDQIKVMQGYRCILSTQPQTMVSEPGFFRTTNLSYRLGCLPTLAQALLRIVSIKHEMTMYLSPWVTGNRSQTRYRKMAVKKRKFILRVCQPTSERGCRLSFVNLFPFFPLRSWSILPLSCFQ